MNPWNTIFELPPIRSGGVLNPAKGWLSIVKPIARTNLITNPSFETNTTNWGAVTASAVARSTTQQYHGAYSLAVTPTAGSVGGALYGGATSLSVTAGNVYAVSMKILGKAGGTYSLGVGALVSPLDAEKRFVATGKWQWVSLVYKAPSTGSNIQLFIRRVTPVNDTTVFYIDGVQFELCETDNYFPTTYIDGDQLSLLPAGQFPPAYGWNGTRHGSTSYRTAQTRDGGRVMNLDMFKLLLTGIIGLGRVSPSHIVTSRQLIDGVGYQTTILNPRDFVLEARLNTQTFVDREQQLQALYEAMNLDATNARQPLVLQYQRYDGLEPRSEVGKIVASYRGGLGENLQGPVGEDFSVQFTHWLPFISVRDEGALLTQASDVSIPTTLSLMYRNESGVWSLLSSVTGGDVFTIAYDGVHNEYYFGGNFTNIGGIAANNIAKWNPTSNTWSALGTGTNGVVRRIVVGADGTPWLCGFFTTANGVTVNRVTYWNGTTFVALGGATKGVDADAYGLNIDAFGNVYVTGDFLNAGGAGAVRIAKWDGASWSALSTGLNIRGRDITIGLGGTVIYVAGEFTTAGGVSATRIASWDGTAFSALGTGLSGTALKLATAPNGDIYVGGLFATAGGITVNGVARWNGTVWQVLGDGLGTSGAAQDIAFGDDGLFYVGGTFSSAGTINVPGTFVAWNGSSFILSDLVMPGTIGGSTAYSLRPTPRGGLLVFFETSNFGTAKAAAINTLTNNGSAPAYPTIFITGPSSGSSRVYQIRNYTAGPIISFDLTILSNEEITITFNQSGARILSSIRGDLSGKILPGSSIVFPLLKGSNSVAVLVNAAATSAVIRWSKQYQSLAELAY